MSTAHVKARRPPLPPTPIDADEIDDGNLFDDDDGPETNAGKDNPLIDLDISELKRLGLFFVSESARQKSARHARCVEATIARRNHEARMFKEAEERRMLQATKDEHERLRRISERINRNSALHVDQWQTDVMRKNRLALVDHLRKTRKKRSDIVAGPKRAEPKPLPPMPDIVYVGLNPVDYQVLPNKVMLTMGMNEKHTRDQLKAAKQHKAKLATVIRQEMEDTKKMFPGLLLGTVPVASGGGVGGRSSSSEVAKRNVLAPRPLSGTMNNQTEAPHTAPARPATAGGKARPALFDTLADPLRSKENDDPAATASYTFFSNAAAPLAMLTSPTSPGKGGLTIRRPHSSPLVRPQRPTSPILRFVKNVERDGRLSTRYDSPAVALHAPQPVLPPRLGVPHIRPDVAVRYDIFGAVMPES